MQMEGKVYTAAARKNTSANQTKNNIHVIVHDVMQTGIFTTVSAAVGDKNNPSAVTTANDPSIKNGHSNEVDRNLSVVLQSDIVPGIVEHIIRAYPAGNAGAGKSSTPRSIAAHSISVFLKGSRLLALFYFTFFTLKNKISIKFVRCIIFGYIS